MAYEQRAQVQTASVASTASTTTAYAAFALPVRYDAMLVVGNLVGLTGGTLDVYLQDSFDGGTTWYDALHFTQVTAAGTKKEAYTLTSTTGATTIGIGTAGTPGVALAVATARPAPWGPLMRVVSVSGSGTSGSAAVQTITFIPTDYSY